LGVGFLTACDCRADRRNMAGALALHRVSGARSPAFPDFCGILNRTVRRRVRPEFGATKA
jgi:hypothetical protein